MSDPVDVLLRDPSEAELVAALERCYIAHPKGRGRWKTQIDEVAAYAEGQSAISTMTSPGRTTHVLLAWWSDHVGGKHVRVRGGDKVNLRTHLSRLDRDARPPLWQVYPERVYRVKRGYAEPVWLASCACGVTGLPREVAWMGPRCGPCHDRREEGDLGAVSEGKTILRDGGVVNALAFAPDKEAIAAVIQNCLLLEIQPDSRENPLYGEPFDNFADTFAINPLMYSPDGRWLAFGESAAGQAILLDRSTNQLVTLSLDQHSQTGMQDMAFSPGSDHFTACDSWRRGCLFRWTGSIWAEVRSFEGVTAVAISGDGQRLAVGGSGGAVRLYSTDAGAKIGQVSTGARGHETVLFLAWAVDDKNLILLTGSDNDGEVRESPKLRRWNLMKRRETHSHSDFGTASLLAMSPDARYLASVYHDDQHSPSAIHFWDLVDWYDVGWIEWDPEDAVHALAFSPDNETLAIGTHYGRIKLVPWRQLLVG